MQGIIRVGSLLFLLFAVACAGAQSAPASVAPPVADEAMMASENELDEEEEDPMPAVEQGESEGSDLK